MLRFLLMPLVLLILTGLSLLSPGLLQAAPQKGKNLPAFEATTVTGQRITLGTYAGKVLLIAVTSDDCNACKKGIPALGELFKRYESQGFQVLGLIYGARFTAQNLKEYINDYKVGYTMAMAEEKTVKNTMGIFSIPCYLILDRKGTIAGIFRGYNETNMKLMEKQVKNMLTE
jgi:cytochrome c biogenesis protein CcmG, thiol:disulfide interchange protein DsbE